MRRVLHVTPYLDPSAGGPPVVVRRLQSLAGISGWSARILTSPDFTSDGARQLAGEADVSVVPSQLASFWGGGHRQVRAEVAGADIVHCHTLWSPLVSASAGLARRLGIPYVVSPHGMLDPYSLTKKSLKKRLYLNLVEARLLKQASCVIFTTNAERELAIPALSGADNSKVIALGADAPDRSRADLAAGFLRLHPELSERPLIIFLGRLHEKKRPEAAIEAMQRVRQSVPAATLLMVGSGEERAVNQLKALAAEHGLGDAIQFTGFLEGEAKWQALAASSLFVLPSRQENFAIAAAEALQAGLPVVLTSSVNICEEVVGAGAGLRLDDGNLVQDLADQIVGILLNPGNQAEMSLRASELATRAYSWPATARATYSLYEDILQQYDRTI